MTEVLRVVKDENCTVDQLAEVLMRDPGLTGNILRIANSPFYGAGRKIGTMSRAIMTIGMRQVTALALSASVYSMTSDWQYSLDRLRFWRHSLEVAIASRLVAESVGYPRPEEAFIAGLLHDIGMLVMEKSYPDEFGRVWRRAEREGNMTAIEEQTWGTNHARIGQFVLEQWQLPESICQAVGYHHTTFENGIVDDDQVSCLIVNLAHLVSKFAVSPETPVNAALLVNREILRDELKIPVEKLHAVEKQLFSRTLEEAAFLEIDVGSPDDIMMEANRMLFDQYVAVENLLKEIREMQKQIALGEDLQSSIDTLRSSVMILSQYINDASMTIDLRAHSLQDDIHNGAIIDRQGKTAPTVDVIINSNKAVSTIADELVNISQLENPGEATAERIARVETLVQKQLAAIEESAGT